MEYGIKDENIPMIKQVERPWGYYKMFAENIECTAKVLHIRPHEMLSLQYHIIRYQLYYIMDEFEIYLSDEPVPEEFDKNMDLLNVFVANHVKKRLCKKGDIVYIPKRVIHRPMYKGFQPEGCIVDMAFGHNDESDIIRIEDKYGRETCLVRQ
jgi:mannose-6-phosphate isomerase-like protein (cupin superfamily)